MASILYKSLRVVAILRFWWLERYSNKTNEFKYDLKSAMYYWEQTNKLVLFQNMKSYIYA